MILCFLKSKFVFQSAFSNKTASYCNSFLIFKRTKKKFSIKILSRTVCIVFNKLVEFSLKRNCLSCFKAFRIDGGFSFFLLLYKYECRENLSHFSKSIYLLNTDEHFMSQMGLICWKCCCFLIKTLKKGGEWNFQMRVKIKN